MESKTEFAERIERLKSTLESMGKNDQVCEHCLYVYTAKAYPKKQYPHGPTCYCLCND